VSYDRVQDVTEIVADPRTNRMRSNDGAVDSRGRFWVSSFRSHLPLTRTAVELRDMTRRVFSQRATPKAWLHHSISVSVEYADAEIFYRWAP